MSKRINRRVFAKTGAVVALGLTPLEVAASTESPQTSNAAEMLDVRPYQLMCIVCRVGGGQSEGLRDARLNEILAAVRKDPKLPIRLRMNADSVYRYQNPGPAEDTPEGELFNIKRDLDIIQKLGLVPGDARPAIDLFERLLANIPTAMGICGYKTATADTWRGCPQAACGDYEKGRTMGVKALVPPRDEQEKAEFKKASTTAIYQATTLRIRPHHLMCMACFFGDRMDKFSPIAEDNLYEAIDVVQKNLDIPIKLIRGTCMICPPCSHYDPKTKFCIGGRSMALRDQKKDLDVLQKLGLKYGDTLPARKLYKLLFERIPSTRDICGYGDGKKRAAEWSICGDPEGRKAYSKARSAMLGIDG